MATPLNDTVTTALSTLSLHDALPIFAAPVGHERRVFLVDAAMGPDFPVAQEARRAERDARRRGGLNAQDVGRADRKSTRLNSSHSQISYAVFCLKKKNLSDRGHFVWL